MDIFMEIINMIFGFPNIIHEIKRNPLLTIFWILFSVTFFFMVIWVLSLYV